MPKKTSSQTKPKSTEHSVTLSEIADVFRLPPTLKNEKARGGKKVQVLMQTDLPLYGYTSSASQTYTLSKATIDKIDKYFLKPWDVIVSSAGDKVGKSHIVPEDIDQSMIPTITLFLIRFKEDQKDNAISLATFLNSGIGTESIEKMITGTTVQRINIKDFKELKVPVLDAEVKKQSRQIWNNEIKAYQKMLEYRDRIEAGRSKYLV